ncbi:MAG: hypothetical protein F4X66_17530 [Chloroflexi bacterium]|nr:hypothetical protein [Chloroflexota bacterium]MYE39413.1 hypothetical protein [Chloroflexota bacterium]
MSDAEIIASLSAAGALVVFGAVLMILAGALSQITPKGETKRNLWLFFLGVASVVGGLVWIGMVYRSFGT